jgi:hypothetical protein
MEEKSEVWEVEDRRRERIDLEAIDEVLDY